MPVVHIIVNKEASLDAKRWLAKSLTELIAAECRVPLTHVHVLVMDNQFFSFGNDVDKTAAYVTVKSSALQILPEARRKLIAELVPILQRAFPDLEAYRVNTMFEELPVENIAVGAHIATFSSLSTRGSAGGATSS